MMATPSPSTQRPNSLETARSPGGRSYGAAFNDLSRYPLVKLVGGPIHHWREMSAVEEVAVAPLLHAFDSEHVLFKDDFPQTRILSAELIQTRRLRRFHG